MLTDPCAEIEFKKLVEQYFKTAKWVKPAASRGDSREIFLFAENLIRRPEA